MGIRGVDDNVHRKMVDIGQGMTVEQDVLNIVTKIRQYDPNLTVQYLDPDRAEITDAPYMLMEECPDGLRRPVMEIWELDERVLEKIYAADTQRFDVLGDLDEANALASLNQKRRYKEQVAAVSEMVQGILKSPKDTYTATNPVTGQSHKFRSLRQSD